MFILWKWWWWWWCVEVRYGDRLPPICLLLLQVIKFYIVHFKHCCMWYKPLSFVTVPDYVLLLRESLKSIQIPGDIFFTTMKLHLQFQIEACCPIELRPFSACFCTLLRLLQLLCSNESDNWLLQSAHQNKLFVHNDFPKSWASVFLITLLATLYPSPPPPIT